MEFTEMTKFKNYISSSKVAQKERKQEQYSNKGKELKPKKDTKKSNRNNT